MLEWTMAHPYLTGLLAFWVLCIIDSAITNLFRFGNNILRIVHFNKTGQMLLPELGGDIE